MNSYIPDNVRCYLNDIFELIIRIGLPKDDTFLEKLLDWFQENVPSIESDSESSIRRIAVNCNGNANGTITTRGPADEQANCNDVSIAFLESTSVLPFLHECLTTDQLPSAVLAFVLKLCARLGGGRGYVSLGGNSLLGRLLQMARSSDQWTHPSVRCALFLMLRSMCENEAGVDWLLEKDVVDLARGCLGDPSLYVQESARSLLAACMSRMHEQHDRRLGALLHPLLLSSPPSQLSPTLRLLQDMCAHNVAFARYLCTQHALIRTLAAAVMTAPAVIGDTCQLIGSLLRNNCVSEDDWTELKVVPMTLAKVDRCVDAIRLACSLHNSCSDELSSPALRDAMLSPVYTALGRRSPDCDLSRFIGHEMDRSTVAWQRLLQEALTGLEACPERHYDVLPLLSDLLLHLGSTDDNKLPLLPIRLCAAKCSRLQQKILILIITLLKGETKLEEQDKVLEEIGARSIDVLLEPSTPVNVVSAAFDCCLHTLLRHRRLFGDTKPDAVTSRLAGCLRRRVHDVNWEVRDSSLEFLTQLTGGLRDEPALVTWVIENKLSQHAVYGMADGQSYVRASALKMLQVLSEDVALWEHLLTSFGEEMIYGEVVRIIAEDTEAFARRAAIDLIASSVDRAVFTEERTARTVRVMTAAMHDFDSTAKVGVIRFWGRYCATRSGDADTCGLEALCGSGAGDALMAALDDCDYCVQACASTVLRELASRCEGRVTAALTTPAAESATTTPAAEFATPAAESATPAAESSMTTPAAEFARRLAAVDFDAIDERAKRSVDEYSGNVASLMADIVDELRRMEDPEAHITADCY